MGWENALASETRGVPCTGASDAAGTSRWVASGALPDRWAALCFLCYKKISSVSMESHQAPLINPLAVNSHRRQLQPGPCESQFSCLLKLFFVCAVSPTGCNLPLRATVTPPPPPATLGPLPSAPACWQQNMLCHACLQLLAAQPAPQLHQLPAASRPRLATTPPRRSEHAIEAKEKCRHPACSQRRRCCCM